MDRRLLVACLAALTVLAGCTGTAPAPGGGETAPPDDGGSSGALTPAGGENATVTVTRVVDGDTMKVEFENGIEDTVRLLGVDTPEVHSENTPEEFEGVPDTEAGRACLRRYGEGASQFATERLEGRTVTLRFDPDSDRRGSYGRLLGYLVVDGQNFNYRLLQEGHARVYDSSFSLRSAFEEAEAAAMEDGAGLWSCREPGAATATPTATDGGSTDGRVRIARIHADAEGNDNENLNDEYVVLENVAGQPVDLSGWTVSDAAGATYTVPEGTSLQPGATVTLHTGSGTDDESALYWGRSGAVWNNGGDTVTVRDTDGTVVAERSY